MASYGYGQEKIDRAQSKTGRIAACAVPYFGFARFRDKSRESFLDSAMNEEKLKIACRALRAFGTRLTQGEYEDPLLKEFLDEGMLDGEAVADWLESPAKTTPEEK